VFACSAGGANLPALNELLEPYGVALGDMVLEGQLPELAGDAPWYASGANIVKWPAAGWLHAAVLADKASEGGQRTAAGPALSLTPSQV
jgi:membrane-bound transcription factor site-1 protease